MRRFVDLHTHSAASDGSMSPAALIEAADRSGLAAVALTDHDTTAGLAEARREAEAREELRFVPGIEVSAKYHDAAGTMHILALGLDENAPGIIELTAGLVAARDERNPKIIARLVDMGMAVTMGDVQEVAAEMHGAGDRTITSRMHIAEMLRRKGLVATVADAFDRYIGAGCPAYVEKDRMSPSSVVRALRDAGAVVALAHPALLNCSNSAQLLQVVKDMMSAGLDALEVYHPSHSHVQTRQYLELARHLGLEVTGGSDFHGLGKPDVRLGLPRVPLAALTGRLAEMTAPRSKGAS